MPPANDNHSEKPTQGLFISLKMGGVMILMAVEVILVVSVDVVKVGGVTALLVLIMQRRAMI